MATRPSALIAANSAQTCLRTSLASSFVNALPALCLACLTRRCDRARCPRARPGARAPCSADPSRPPLARRSARRVTEGWMPPAPKCSLSTPLSNPAAPNLS
eukprot:1100952-Lingulodinium_polyedra.AAC.1